MNTKGMDELSAENERLLRELQLERQLTEVLDNIRNNALVLIQNCKCTANQHLIQTINQFNGIYSDLKVRQYFGKNSPKTKATNRWENTNALQTDYVKQEVNECQNQSQNNFTFITEILNVSAGSDDQIVEEVPVIIADSNASLPYECMECDYKTCDRSSYETHWSTAHLSSSSRSLLRTSTTTTTSSTTTGAVDLQKCKECHKVYKTKNSLYQHRVCVHSADTYRCPHEGCNRIFSSKEYYKKHMTIHTTVRTHQCLIDGCNKMFKNRNCLNVHKVTTHSTKEFPCGLCHKVFKTITLLNRHKTRHKP